MNTKTLLSALVVSVILAGAAQAAIVAGDVIVIDFGKAGPGLWTGSNGPGAQTTGNWNNVARTNDSGSTIDGSSISLVSNLIRYSDGASTGVALNGAELSVAAGTGIGGADVSQNSPQLSFTSSGLIPYSAEQDVFYSGTTFTFTFTGLDNSLTYNLEALSRFNNLAATVPSAPARNARNWTIQQGVLGQEVTISVDPDINPSSIIAFNNVATNGSGTITLTMLGAGGADLVHINAIELTAVPEPGSLAFFALSGLVLLGFVRRCVPGVEQ